MKTYFYKSFIFTGIMFLTGLISAPFVFGQSSTTVCSENLIPVKLLAKVKSQFPGWRIKTNEDMEPNHQMMWQENRFLECPGLAKGDFFDLHIQTFGLMLINDAPNSKGFKVVAIASRGKNKEPEFRILKDEKNQDQERFVIYQATKGTFFDSEKKQQITLKNDGIYLEDMEMGLTLYYWEKNHFEKLVVVH